MSQNGQNRKQWPSLVVEARGVGLEISSIEWCAGISNIFCVILLYLIVEPPILDWFQFRIILY